MVLVLHVRLVGREPESLHGRLGNRFQVTGPGLMIESLKPSSDYLDDGLAVLPLRYVVKRAHTLIRYGEFVVRKSRGQRLIVTM